MQAYRANEVVVTCQPSLGTFRFRVLTENHMLKTLSEYGKSGAAKQVCNIIDVALQMQVRMTLPALHDSVAGYAKICSNIPSANKTTPTY